MHSSLATGKAALKSKDYSQAKIAFETVLAEFPADPEALLGLGHMYRKTRQIEAALDHYYAALNAHVQTPSFSASQTSNIHKQIAALELHRRHYNEALAAIESAIGLNAENPDHFQIRGQIHFEIADYENAQVDFEKALALAPEDHKLLEMLAKTIQQQKVTKYLNQALEAYQNARDQDALKAVNQALELDSQNLEGRFLRGKIRTLTRDYNGAEIDLKLALKALPQHVEIHYRLGDLYRRAKAYDAALTAYNLAEKMNSHFPQFDAQELCSLYLQRAFVYGELGQFDAAQADLDLAKIQQPDNPRHENMQNWLQRLRQGEKDASPHV